MKRVRNNLAGIGRKDIERAEVEPKNKGLSHLEQETIIIFNKEEADAHVFTYEYTWQRHLEKRFGLTPVMDNGFGGKEYIVPKTRISKPLPFREKRILSEEQKAKLRQNVVIAQKSRHRKP